MIARSSVISVTPQINKQSPQALGLVAAWPLNDSGGATARDAGGGYHGTITNPLRTIFKTGSCLLFDGTNRYVNCGVNSYVDGLEQLTVSLLFRPSVTGANTTNKALVSKWDGALGNQFVFSYGNDTASKVVFSIRTGGTGTGGSSNSSGFSPNALSPGLIYHLVGVYNGVDVKLYVNGVLASSGAGSGAINTNVTANLVLGKYTTSTNQYLLGSLSDVRIYTRALFAAEVQQIYLRPQDLYAPPRSLLYAATIEEAYNIWISGQRAKQVWAGGHRAQQIWAGGHRIL